MDPRLENAIRLVKQTKAPIGLWMIDRRYANLPNYPDAILEFCERAEVAAEEWMAQSLVVGAWVGCVVCNHYGKQAACFGRAGCHGFLNGCGCWHCLRLEKTLGGHGSEDYWGPFAGMGYRRHLLEQQFAGYLAENPGLIDGQATATSAAVSP